MRRADTKETKKNPIRHFTYMILGNTLFNQRLKQDNQETFI